MSTITFVDHCLMPVSRSSLLVLALPLLLSACGGEPEDTRPGQPVAHRRAAFKEIVKTFEPMGIMLRDGSLDIKTFQPLAQRLQQQAGTPWDYFGSDTQYPPSRATDAVWQQPEQFARQRQAFLDASQKLATLSGQGAGRDDLLKAYETLHQTCRDCHKTFKSR